MIGVGFEVNSEPSDWRFANALVKTSAKVLTGKFLWRSGRAHHIRCESLDGSELDCASLNLHRRRPDRSRGDQTGACQHDTGGHVRTK